MCDEFGYWVKSELYTKAGRNPARTFTQLVPMWTTKPWPLDDMPQRLIACILHVPPDPGMQAAILLGWRFWERGQ